MKPKKFHSAFQEIEPRGLSQVCARSRPVRSAPETDNREWITFFRKCRGLIVTLFAISSLVQIGCGNQRPISDAGAFASETSHLVSSLGASKETGEERARRRLGFLGFYLDTAVQDRDEPEWSEHLHALHNKYLNQFMREWLATQIDSEVGLGSKLKAIEHIKYDLRLLEIITEEPMPLEGRALLYMLGDIFYRLERNLNVALAYREFFCSFSPCSPGLEDGGFFNLVEAIAKLPGSTQSRITDEKTTNFSPPTAKSKQSEAVGNGGFTAQMHRILERIGSPVFLDVLKKSVADVSESDSYVQPLMMPKTNLPYPLAFLTPFVDRNKNLSIYARRSIFHAAGKRGRISVPISRDRIKQWVGEAEAKRRSLKQELDNFKTTRLSRHHLEKETCQNHDSSAGYQARLGQIEHKMSHESEAIVSIQHDIAKSSQSQTFDATISKIIDDDIVDINQEVQRGASKTAFVKPSHARRGDPSRISSWAVPNDVMTPVQASAGSRIHVSVGGSWSPTCALVQTYGNSAQNAAAGPEGFDVQNVEGKFVTKGVQSSDTTHRSEAFDDSYETNTELHEDIGFNFFGLGGGIRLSARESKRASINEGTSHSVADSETKGSETRSNAAFAVGIRVDSTPFPTFPAGSLLLVQVPINSDKPPKVDVVRSQMALLVDEDAQVYLVVNDAAKSSCRSDQEGGLSVNLQVTQTVGTRAEFFTAAMNLAIQTLQEKLALMDDSPATFLASNALRSELRLILHRSGVGKEQIPAEVFHAFEIYVDQELANWERKVNIREKTRDLVTKALEAEALRAQLKLNGEQRRLIDTAQSWTLADLDAEKLQWRAENLMTYVSDTLMPSLDILYPDIRVKIGRMQGGMMESLHALTHDPLNPDILVRGQALVDIVGRIEDEIAAAQSKEFNDGNWGATLQFKRPDRVSTDMGAEADAGQAAMLWQALERGGVATFTIRPEDLYNKYLNYGEVLRCSQGTPVVRAIKGYFVRPGGLNDHRVSNFDARSMTLRVHPDILFATPASATKFTFAGMNLNIPVKSGPASMARSHNVWHASAGHGINEAQGLTPFATFSVTFQEPSDATDRLPFAEVLRDATSFVLMFDLETRNCDESKMRWIESCR